MDAISAAASADMNSAIGIAVARKALDHAESQGEAVVSLLESAADLAQSTTRGRVAPTPGPGEGGAAIDLTA